MAVEGMALIFSVGVDQARDKSGRGVINSLRLLGGIGEICLI